ncbi:YaaC family protein [Aeribacillus pallidus]|uniref:YaaC family protein n=1 Tax=Aeribacillus pallidus TaxID=33936 RepID=UPI003D1BC3AA
MYTFMNPWKHLTYFQNAEFAQQYLYRLYNELEVVDASEKSYRNAIPFMYYLENGETYFQYSKIIPLTLQPILLFYGLVHLIKACVLTVDPFYPHTTSVLAHGLSTRKKKKQQYLFLEDEVKIQKNGLFSYANSIMFHVKHLEGQKLVMQDLLRQIPELSDTFFTLLGEQTFFTVTQSQQSYVLSKAILDEYHMQPERFREYIMGKVGPILQQIDFNDGQIEFKFSEPHIFKQKELPPFRINIEQKTPCLSTSRHFCSYFNEIMVHYSLLYNLSMIARYETEWWNELMKFSPNYDYVFIKSFLSVSLKKVPYLIAQFLCSKHPFQSNE